MCIMEVRPGQQSATIAQAMAHNTSTIERDLDMFEALLTAREEWESLRTVRHAHEHLRQAYASLLGEFGVQVTREVQDSDGHAHEHDGTGSERSLVAQAHHDATQARRFMTR